ncbi:protein SMAX1-like [Musa acuminata AAA Group]|uniref:protein SMAX1-like n=1 Tax=Musa acuminata AAA Group TaxID=214697 RepID=UPI0031E13E56
MRTEVATIQQMLTPEAAAVLMRSVEEARRRRHGQTTPLHVAANLLAAPSGLLRRACAVSHPLLSSSSHPLHCRALELCFSVALDRLPASASSSSADAEQPPLSNALVAAVKRAQAHQRRGCPEQQQQQPPLLAVKVELGHLVVSVLDDPSVSRVMREAGFSSPAVKAAIEHSLFSDSDAAAASPSLPGTRNVYISPRLQQKQGRSRPDAKKREEVKKVLDIMTRVKKRNPVLVGDFEAASVMEEVLTMIEKEELGMDNPATLRLAQVVSLEKEFSSSERSLIPRKINELYGTLEHVIRARSTNGGMAGLVLDLGDLKWLVESPGGSGASSVQQMARAALTEMGRLLSKLREGDGSRGRVWVVGTATCATYLRCQVYHPTMEGDWDLQAVPIPPRSPPMAGLFPRSGGNDSASSSIMAAGTAAIVLTRPLESSSCSQPAALCQLCMAGYQHELAKLVPNESEGRSSKPGQQSKGSLPRWLQIAVPSRTPASDHHLQIEEQELLQKEKAEELLRKWCGRCTRLHMNLRANVITSGRTPAPSLPMLSSRSCTILPQQHLEPTPTRNDGDGSLKPNSLEDHISPVKTDLVLGLSRPLSAPLQKPHGERTVALSKRSWDQFSDQRSKTITGIPDADSLKRISNGLTKAVSWQPEAASAIAAAVVRFKSGNGKRRSVGARAGSWLLFTGPDKVGKRKMAAALSELMFNAAPVRINLGSPSSADGDDGEMDVKTLLDQIAEAIQQNPCSIIVLEDIDHADDLVRGTIKRAIESGRLLDSRGREVSHGGIIFILISDRWPDNLRNSEDCHLQCRGWQLELSFGEKSRKRHPDPPLKNEQPPKQRKQSCSQGLSLDLNLAVSEDDDDGEEGSWNSSDLTVEHEHKYGQLAVDCPTSSSNASELIDIVDEAIVFNPVDFSTLKKTLSESISSTFTRIMGTGRPLRIDEEALDRIVGGVWQSGATTVFDEWTDRVLVPSINQLRSNSEVNNRSTVRLSSVKANNDTNKGGCAGNWLPSSVSIAIHGA